MSVSTAQIVMFPLIYSNYCNYVHLLCVLFVYIQYNIKFPACLFIIYDLLNGSSLLILSKNTNSKPLT